MQELILAAQPAQNDGADRFGTDVASLAAEILALESETFEITDYSDASEVMLGSSTSCSSTSTCSSTTSTTSCSA
jgi:thiazolylpeptide-type bacteriocin precursor